uniref:HAT C-terminal dimerisation domain-containing protein n=1 Tax=Amphimedon queenslandica TaxID=400682 RepID=A0A1X7TXR3_AMPQE
MERFKEQDTEETESHPVTIEVEEDGTQEAEVIAAKRKKVKALDYLLGPEVEKNGFTPREEFDSFLAEIEPPRSTSPNLWWKDNHSRFPLVSKVAQCYLNIPATSTPSE